MVSVMLYPGMFCVALSMDLFVLYVACLSVFVNCLVKHHHRRVIKPSFSIMLLIVFLHH